MIGLACATLSCDGFEDKDFVKTFEMMSKAGFKYVEFNCWFPSSITLKKMRDLKRRCENSGLIPVSIHGNSFGGGNRNDLTKDVAHKLWMLEAAKELGCRRILATGSGRGEQGGLEAIITVLREIAPAAEEYDMLISLENHKNNNLESIEDYQKIFEVIDSPNVGICLDTGHFDASDVDMDKLIESLGNKINHIHLKENRGKGQVDFPKFGEGTTENNRIIEKMLGRGYSGFLTVELSPQKDRPVSLEDLITPRKMFDIYESKY